MKKILSMILSIICLSNVIQANDDVLKIASFNILYDNTSDPQSAWAARKNMALDLINTYDFDLLGLQEVSQTILADLKTLEKYNAVGEAVNGGTSGVQNTILYRKDRFNVLASGIFWLSATPDKVSLGWDAKNRRNCTWLKLQDKNTNKIFFYINTHFDHEGVVARDESARLFRDTIPQITEGYPAFFMGDLNCMEMETPIMTLKEKLIDPRSISLSEPKGSYGTGHGFRFDINVRRIDWILLSNGNGRNRIAVDSYEVINKKYDGKSPSDHWPVYIQARLIDGQATLKVTSNKDDNSEGTLRHVLSEALPGDSIVIDKAVNNITLNSVLNVDKSISINGQETTIQVAQPGVSAYKAFVFGTTANEETIRIHNMTIKGGRETNGAVALINQNTKFFANNVVFRDGVSTASTGGLHVNNGTGTEVVLRNCSFINNEAKSNAGGFYSKGLLVMDNCLFENNSTESNGAALTANGTADIKNCIFRGNTSKGTGDYGGAVFITTSTAIANFDNCLFEENISTNTEKGAGAFGCSGAATTTFRNSTFWKNSGATAAVFYNRAGKLSLINCSVSGNTTTNSNNGALHIYDANNASADLINNIMAYNYNKSGYKDISVGGANSIVSGEYNLVSSSDVTLNNPISFIYDETLLFESYTTITFDGKTVKIPELAQNGGSSSTLALASTSIAIGSGTNSLENVIFPIVDQRLYDRNLTNYTLGAFDVTECSVTTSPNVISVTADNVQLVWDGKSYNNYDVEYKPVSELVWTQQQVNSPSIILDNLHSQTTYEWRVKSTCNQDWIYGAEFETPFSFIVRSGADDGGKETLRYIIEHAASGDSITIANEVDTVKLAYILPITKSITINGNGKTIQPMIPGTDFNPFTLGTTDETVNNIRLYNMKLLGGKSTSGGIILVNQYTTLYAENVTFKGGIASEYSGAVHCNSANGTETEFVNCRFENNMSENNAGALYAKGKLTITACSFTDNSTRSNGSALANIGNATIRKSVFANNVADGAGNYGAAVFSSNTASIMTFDDCSFISNSNTNTSKGAAAFASSGNSNATFTNCTFWDNKGATTGAVYNYAGKLTFINSTLSGNIASLNASGGALHSMSNNSNNITLLNTIITHNYSQQNHSDISKGNSGLVDGSNNIIGTASGQGFNYVNTTNFIYNTNEALLFKDYETVEGITIPQPDNSYFTPVIVLAEGSIANGAGINNYETLTAPSYDQVGNRRSTMPSVGAYEFPTSLGISTNKEQETSIYPNPVKDIIHIESNKDFNSFEVYTMVGIIVISGEISDSQINLTTLEKGAYIVRLIGDSVSYSTKIIKVQ